MLVVMECGQMGLAFALATLVGLQVVQIWQMAAILALARICVTFELPSRQVFFYELVGPEFLPNAIVNSGLFNATRVLGPAFAGVCLSTLGATGCFAEWSELSGGDCRHSVDPTSRATPPHAYRGLRVQRDLGWTELSANVIGGFRPSSHLWHSSASWEWATMR